MNAIIDRKGQGPWRFGTRSVGRTLVIAAALVLAGAVSPASARDKKKGQPQRVLERPDGPRARTLQRPGAAKEPVTPKVDVKGPKPIITAEETVHDFGTVWVGPKLENSFTIKNTGDAELKITRVKPSCGCTIAGNYPRSIAPGESGVFPFSINTKRLRSRFSKFITITSNDPVTPQLRLQLRGEVKQYVDVTPAHANFGRLLGNEAQERILNIQNNTEGPLKLELDKTADGGFKYELITKEEGQKYELRVKVEPPFVAGMMKGNIRLKTNIDKQKQVDIVARAAVPERIDVQPKSISVINRATAAKGMTRVIRFTNYGDTPVKLLEATANDPDIKLNLNERTPGKAYTVLVELPPNYDPPVGGSKITLKTDDAQKPVIDIPVISPTKQRQAKKPTTRPAQTLVGTRAPATNAQTVEGKPINNDTFKQNITILDFFAVNCGFCKKQLPRLETVRKQFADKGVRFVAVGQTMRKPYTEADTKAKLDELGFQGELVYDPDNKLGRGFKATSFPTMVVVGKSGKIEAVNIGNVADLESRLKGQLDALIAGKPVPKDKPAVAQKPKRARPEDLVGKSAPAFALKTMDDKPLGKAELAKAPATILNFFAPNCGYCKKQIPRLETIRKKYIEKGVRFVNVSQKMGKPYEPDAVKDILAKLGYEGELAINHDNSVGRKFNVSGFPTMVVLGKTGKIEAVNVGNVGDLDTRLPKQLDAIIAGKPIPDEVATKPPSNKPTERRRRPAEELAGKPAPSFSITTMEGKVVSNDDFKNHPATVLNFVAPNCGFCKRQLPNVEKVRKEYESKGVRFVNIAQTMRKEYSAEETKKVFDGTGAKLELAKDDGNKIGKMYKAVSFPTMIVVDKTGKISNVNIGARANLETELKAQLDTLIKGAGGTQ